MPRGDGTGPMGAGPMSGRGAGYCAGYPAPGFMNAGPGWGGGGGMGWGRGRGFGRRAGAGGVPGRWWGAAPYATAPAPEPERSALARQAESLGRMLAQVKERLAQLDASGDNA